MRPLAYIIMVLLMGGCTHREPGHFTHEVLNRMTPVKNQGESQTCWIYAMLAAIETEHLSWGDSVNLSPYYIEKKMEQEPQAPESKRGMGKTLINLIQKYGIVGYDAMRKVETPAPRWVFMLGATYTPQEFARSVCAPHEYIALTSTDDAPYGQEVEIDLPDNWMHDRFLNIPMDSLLSKTEHAMAIVGIAHDDQGQKYFIMKNSWGTDRPHQGLDYLSFEDFREETLAIEMTKKAYHN